MPATVSPLRASAFSLLCVLVLSLLEFRAVDLLHAPNLPAEVEAAAGVLSGRPYWKAYQNRLLGPAVVGGIVRLTGWPPASVYRGFCFVLLSTSNFLAVRLFRRAGGPPGAAWGYAIASAGLFVAWQDPGWLYLWDFVDLVTMLLFAWAVVIGNWGAGRFAALFVLELANRESAQFIALWLVLDSILPEGNRPGRWARWVDGPRLALGIALGVAGAAWTHWVRNTLCLGETGVLPRPEIVELADGQFFMGRVTLDLLRDPWNLAAAMLGILLASLAFLLWRARRPLGRRAWKVVALLASMTAANLCFAFIYELRVWFALLPFTVCLACRGRTALVPVSLTDGDLKGAQPQAGTAS